jgi:hypothetical protein
LPHRTKLLPELAQLIFILLADFLVLRLKLVELLFDER